jgi:NADH-quinone oxidoreductase subunit N
MIPIPDLFRHPTPIALVALAVLIVSVLLYTLERRGRLGLVPTAALAILALAIATAPRVGTHTLPLTMALVVATLVRDGDQLLHGECALKLVWVMGAALAMSWAGGELLTLATGTPRVIEQWAVLRLGLEPSFLWATALPLTLLVGLVALGGAPFHFWVADVFQGVRPWLAPLAVAGLQIGGAGWLAGRLDGIAAFPAGEMLARSVVVIAALAAFGAAAATLPVQRRPERRVGTFASLQGALVLAMLARGTLSADWIVRWGTHLVLALAGASTLARFLPAESGALRSGAPLFRRHPVIGLAGLVSLFSLAGFPGTPGARLWLDAARSLAASGRALGLLVMGAAWLTGVAIALRELRDAFGLPDPGPRPSAVPWAARVALAVSGLGLVTIVWAHW